MSPKTPSTPLLNLLTKSLHISKWFQGLDIELNKVANLWQHYGYYQHLSLSYKRWHWWCHDIIIECLEAYDIKSDVDLWVKVCFFADLCIFVPLFCSAIFVPLGPFLFCYFCSTIFVLLTFLHLHLPIFVLLFLVPLFLFRWGLFALKLHLPHYLIDNFCSADLFALALTIFCSAIFVPLFLFCYFCSAIFHWPFCTCTWGPHHPMADSAHQFLFRWPFCTCTVPTNFCLGDSE